MKIAVMLVILVLYYLGYILLQNHPYFKEDPMLAMN